MEKKEILCHDTPISKQILISYISEKWGPKQTTGLKKGREKAAHGALRNLWSTWTGIIPPSRPAVEIGADP